MTLPTVPSPCINICQIDGATGLCGGCLRTLNEIAAWSTMNDAARRDIWLRLAQRRALIALPGSSFSAPPPDPKAPPAK